MKSETKLRTVGQRYRRKDGLDKLTGRAKYPQDIEMEGMLYGCTVRSTIPHGTFTLNMEKAQALEGVVKILTAQDVLAANHHGVLFKDHEVLCLKKVRRVGDPLAFVIAETEELAKAAADLVEVTYEELPAVFDPVKAMAPDAPQVHDGKSNVIYHYKCRKGDVDKAFEEAAVIVENTYYSPFVDHVFLQPESGLAWMEDDVVVVMAATQYPHFDRLEVAEAVGLEEDKIRIINPIVGGAFGGREDITMQIHLALGTMLTGKPIKVTYSREESFYAHSKRHPMQMKCRSAADKNGKYTAFEAEIIGDTGAYASWAINVLRKAGVHAQGPYDIPNVKVDSIAVYTNNPYCGAMRGFGATQVPIMYEQQADMLAEKLGITPIAFRRRNGFVQGSETANGQVLVESVPLNRCIDTIEQAMNLEPKPATLPDHDGMWKTGRGLAVSWYGTGYGNGFPDVSVATVELKQDGTINLRVGATEVGQGAKTIMPQVCAEGLNMSPDQVTMICENTDEFKDSGTAAASRQTYNTGNAVKRATEAFRKRIFKEAAEALGLNSALGMKLEDGKVWLEMLPAKQITLKDLAKRFTEENLMVTETFTAQTVGLDSETGQGAPYWPYTFNAYGVDVAVNVKTGRVQVQKAWCAQDVGRAINPELVEGQIDGGFVMGLGYTLYEDLGVRKGVIGNNKFAKYIIPTSMDIPEIEKFIVEDPENTAPYGAKGIGEPVMVPVAPAILNAIYDAIGVRICSVPATPDKVLAAIQEKQV